MIQDLLADAARYHALHPRLPTAFAWLATQDWSRIADGRHEIAGEDIFAIVEAGQTADPATRRFESHRRYLDIQVPISGGERMGWCPFPQTPVGEQAGPDIWFHPEPADPRWLTVLPGSFVIFVPPEAHKPVCRLGEAGAPFRKCVVKVAWGD
jgi:YhcH/YjgK/YiaL family protein